MYSLAHAWIVARVVLRRARVRGVVAAFKVVIMCYFKGRSGRVFTGVGLLVCFVREEMAFFRTRKDLGRFGSFPALGVHVYMW